MEISEINIESALKHFFGYDSFRYGQLEIIQSVIARHHTLVVMPTGGGKSLCYQLPAILLEGTAIIISPLIALMKDQVDSLDKSDIPATFINSSLPFEENRIRLENTAKGCYKLVYIAPERLESSSFLEMLGRANLSFLAVDEAHCISEWGHDFRPAYLNIIRIIERIKQIPVIALTATATPEVQDDIVQSLKMKNAKRFIRGFDRPNLAYVTEQTDKKVERLAELCNRTEEGSVIVYCGSRKRVDMFVQSLRNMGVNALGYHAGMEDHARKSVQESFIGDKSQIIIATNAFGMGIDKPDVRKVIHCDYTQTLEAYYQEAGRAGRDGKPAECYLLHHPVDRNLQEYFINANFPPKNDVKKLYNSLYDAAGAMLGEKPHKVLPLNLADLANSSRVSIAGANSVIKLLEKNNIIKKGLSNSSAMLRITTTRERIYEFFMTEPEGSQKNMLEALLRSLSYEAFSREVEIDLNHLVEKYELKIDEIMKYLRQFELARLLTFTPSGVAGGIIFTMERLPAAQLPIDFSALEERRKRAEKKLDIVIRYAETGDCKRNYILNYFKENDVNEPCGRCSGCIPVNRPVHSISKKEKGIVQKILRAAAELDGRFGRVLFADFLKGSKTYKIRSYQLDKGETFGIARGIEPIDIDFYIEKVLSEGLLALTPDIYPTLYLTGKGRDILEYKQLPVKIKEFTEETEYSRKVFKELKELRDEIAAREGVTQRAIITDKTLKLIAGMLPARIGDLSGITGVSPYFISKWANYFIEKIQENVAQNESKTEKTEIPEPLKQVAGLVNKGKSLPEIQDFLNLEPAELARLIQQAIESGLQVKQDNLIEREIIELVKTILKKKPNATLQYIRTKMKSDIDYTLLRIALAFARRDIQREV